MEPYQDRRPFSYFIESEIIKKCDFLRDSLTETLFGLLFSLLFGMFHVSKTAVDEKAVAVQSWGLSLPEINTVC